MNDYMTMRIKTGPLSTSVRLYDDEIELCYQQHKRDRGLSAMTPRAIGTGNRTGEWMVRLNRGRQFLPV